MGSKKHGKNKRPKTPNEPHVTTPNPGIVQKTSGAEDIQTQTHNDNQPSKGAIMNWCRPEVIIGIAGVVVGGIVATIYFFQLQTMQAQFTVTRKAMQIDQRAWISMAIDGNPSETPEGIRFEVMANIKNSGKTPALRVAGQSSTLLQPIGDPAPDFDKIIEKANAMMRERGIEPNIGESNAISGIVIAPGDVYTVRLLTAIYGGPNVEQIKSGKVAFYLVAKFTYYDVFNEQHTTKVCARYYAPLKYYSPCDANNWMD